jgi:hypothetical protein
MNNCGYTIVDTNTVPNPKWVLEHPDGAEMKNPHLLGRDSSFYI